MTAPSSPSVQCADFLHHRCEGCVCRCHADEQLFLDVETYGAEHTVGPVYSRELLSHLQGHELRHGLTLDQAARVVRTLIDLGWRPTVAQLVREGQVA